MGRYGRRLIVLALGLAALMAPVSANGAVTIGSDLSGASLANAACAATPCTSINSVVPGAQLTSPIDGVIVRWRLRQGSNTAGPGALRVVRAANPTLDTWTGIRTGETVTLPAAAGTFTFDARLPISAGDAIGLNHPSNHSVIANGSATSVDSAFNGTLADGVTRVRDNGFAAEVLLNADVEPDADRDGFGDETQDACPADAALQEAPCDRVAPDTTIIKGPKDKTRKKSATFEFSGTDARAIAGFQCSLDGAAFAVCSSPFTVKVKKGKHTFSVRATDEVGNVDGAPASDDWKVKKKKK